MPGQFNLGDNYSIDEDSNGNLVIINDTTGTTVLEHTDGGGWTLGANVDAGSNDLTNVGTNSGTNLQYDSVGVGTRTIELVDSYTQSQATSNSVTVNFDNLSPENYFINFADLAVADGTPLEMRLTFNEDNAAGNANYSYWDATGTKQSGTDNIQLADYSGNFARFGGGIIVGVDDEAYAGVNNNIVPQRHSRVNSISQYGGYEGSEVQIYDMQLVFANGLNSESTIELWRWFP